MGPGGLISLEAPISIYGHTHIASQVQHGEPLKDACARGARKAPGPRVPLRSEYVPEGELPDDACTRGARQAPGLVCPHCPAAFGEADKLAKHVRTVNEKRWDHGCPQYPAAVGQASQDHKCPQCSAACGLAGHLRLRTHVRKLRSTSTTRSTIRLQHS